MVEMSTAKRLEIGVEGLTNVPTHLLRHAPGSLAGPADSVRSHVKPTTGAPGSLVGNVPGEMHFGFLALAVLPLLSVVVPVIRSAKRGGPNAGPGMAVPLFSVFSVFSAGVALGGIAGLKSAFADTVAIGIVLALVVGKFIGVLGTTWLVTTTTKAEPDDGLAWIDVVGLALLAEVGFTVSLLISKLSFGSHSPHYSHAKVAILTASVIAALLTAVVLRSRNRHYRKIAELEEPDEDNDGIPDVYQQRPDQQ